MNKIPILIQYHLGECEVWNPDLSKTYKFNLDVPYIISRHWEHYEIDNLGDVLGFTDPSYLNFDNGTFIGGAASSSTSKHHIHYIDVDPNDTDCILPDKSWMGLLKDDDPNNDIKENQLNKILDRLRLKQNFDQTIHIEGMTYFNNNKLYIALHRINKWKNINRWKNMDEGVQEVMDNKLLDLRLTSLIDQMNHFTNMSNVNQMNQVQILQNLVILNTSMNNMLKMLTNTGSPTPPSTTPGSSINNPIRIIVQMDKVISQEEHELDFPLHFSLTNNNASNVPKFTDKELQTIMELSTTIDVDVIVFSADIIVPSSGTTVRVDGSEFNKNFRASIYNNTLYVWNMGAPPGIYTLQLSSLNRVATSLVSNSSSNTYYEVNIPVINAKFDITIQ